MISYLRFLWVKICLISSLKTNVFAFANSFWIIVFFKKLSRNFPLIRSLFTYQFADCFIKFIWLNFYTMKFSRFKFSFCWTFNILTQPVNIVKCFFNFLSSCVSSFQSLPLFDSLIIISNCIRFVKNIFKLFSNFFVPADPLPRGYKRKVRLLSSDSLFILPLLSPGVKGQFLLYRDHYGKENRESLSYLRFQRQEREYRESNRKRFDG